jgi:hypothetical protein
MLDLRVNPGSSGSPLCDARGNVIGIVAARTNFNPFLGLNQQGYGMAVPCADVTTFLKAQLPGFRPLDADAKVPNWEEIDRRISPAVVMVLKSQPAPKGPPQ